MDQTWQDGAGLAPRSPRWEPSGCSYNDGGRASLDQVLVSFSLGAFFTTITLPHSGPTPLPASWQ